MSHHVLPQIFVTEAWLAIWGLFAQKRTTIWCQVNFVDINCINLNGTSLLLFRMELDCASAEELHRERDVNSPSRFCLKFEISINVFADFFAFVQFYRSDVRRCIKQCNFALIIYYQLSIQNWSFQHADAVNLVLSLVYRDLFWFKTEPYFNVTVMVWNAKHAPENWD